MPYLWVLNGLQTGTMNNLTPAVKLLLLLNLAVFGGQIIFNEYDFTDTFGLRNIFAEKFEPYQIVTHMFVHSNQTIMHIIANMFALFMFGPMTEAYLGTKRFAVMYFCAGLGAAILYSGVQMFELWQLEEAVKYYISNPTPDNFAAFFNQHSPAIYQKILVFVKNFSENPDNSEYVKESISFVQAYYFRVSNTPMVGASGAIFGVLMMFALLFPNVELMLLFPPIPMKAKYMVTLAMAYEVYSVINAAPDDNVAHLAHIGGAFFGFFLFKYWKAKKIY
jgi:membrane associated rhomboid family serine protease